MRMNINTLSLAIPFLGALLASAADENNIPSWPPITQARTVDGKQFIGWKEHRIDDSKLAGIGIGGSDGLAIADIDGDGFMDVVSVNEDCVNSVRIAFGTKDPDRWESFTLSPGPGEKAQSPLRVGGAEDVVIGDINGDGRLDVVACGEGGALVYFEAPRLPRKMEDWTRTALTKPSGQKSNWIRVDLGDLDGDGRLEILAAHKGATDWVCFQCLGQPSDAAAWRKHVIGTTRMPINIHARDIDGDGDVDVIGGSRGESITVIFENLGNQKPWSEKWQARTLTERRFTLPTHSGVTIGDVKIAVSRSSPLSSTGFMMEFADLDGGGRTDVVTETGDGVVFWLKQPEKLSYDWRPFNIGHIFPDRPTGLKLADINGDGRLDLFVGGYSHTPRRIDTQTLVRARTPCGRLAWFEQPTLPTQPWKRHDVSRRAQGMYDMFVAHDVNRDGLLDFIATRGNSSPCDGVIWLEQVRTLHPTRAFTDAWPKEYQSREQPLPIDN